MSKRIVICADGTWNRPERDPEKDVPTNVLRLARAIKPNLPNGQKQCVFYDWGIGSYYSKVAGGITGKGMRKNIMDDYSFIVQNYAPGDEIFLFGFSRGAYTVRALSGMINNCGILKRPDARLIEEAFRLYRTGGDRKKPSGTASRAFRRRHSHASRAVRFTGVWDTVGALGIPFSVLGLFDTKDEFYDVELGGNVAVARHALAIDEKREDFEPAIWKPKDGIDIKQVWFAGSHSDIGGGNPRRGHPGLTSDFAMRWMADEARKEGLVIETHLLGGLKDRLPSHIERSRTNFYRLRAEHLRPIDHGTTDVLIHRSVKARLERGHYKAPNLKAFLKKNGGWGNTLV